MTDLPSQGRESRYSRRACARLEYPGARLRAVARGELLLAWGRLAERGELEARGAEGSPPRWRLARLWVTQMEARRAAYTGVDLIMQ